jgi:hypothetical protein
LELVTIKYPDLSKCIPQGELPINTSEIRTDSIHAANIPHPETAIMSHTIDQRGLALINPPRIEAEMHEADEELLEPLAVIGFSFKFPQGADSVEGLWNILEERRDVVTSWQPDRMNFHAFHPDNNRPEAGVRHSTVHILPPPLDYLNLIIGHRVSSLGPISSRRTSARSTPRFSALMLLKLLPWTASTVSCLKQRTMPLRMVCKTPRG